MTDLDPTDHPTVSCSVCGAQSDPQTGRCARCGALLVRGPGETERTDLEVEELWRGASVAGFDDEFIADDTQLVCPRCNNRFAFGDGRDLVSQTAVDTGRGGDEVAVVTLRCPQCDAGLRGVLDADWIESSAASTQEGTGREANAAVTGEAAPDDPNAPWAKTTVTPDRPLGSDIGRFEPAQPGNLRDQMDLTDETGADIREYTGEPVETEQGWVLPQQQNVGPGNEAGSGEWPDPDVPPAMPKDERP